MFNKKSLILKEKKYIVKNITHYISMWHSKLPNNITQHNYVTIYYQLECLSVYFGKNCSDRCLYPHYGYYCQNVCDCTVTDCTWMQRKDWNINKFMVKVYIEQERLKTYVKNKWRYIFEIHIYDTTNKWTLSTHIYQHIILNWYRKFG